MAHSVWTGGSRYTGQAALPHKNIHISDFMDISLEETKKNALPRVLATSSRDIVEEYMMVTPHLCREVEGRLIVVD